MSIRRILFCVVLTMSLLAFLIEGCARNPVSGWAEATLISAEEEREIVAAGARKVQHILGIVEDPERPVVYVKAKMSTVPFSVRAVCAIESMFCPLKARS